jgi:hypothetical protein
MNVISYGQVRIWLLQTYYADKPIYNISFETIVKGKLNIFIFDKAMNILLKQNDVLRTNIKNNNGIPQLFFNNKKFKLDKIYLDNDNKIINIIDKYNNIPFNLESDCLFKILYIQTPNEKQLIFCFSDLIIDGFSINNFISEFAIIYNLLHERKIPIIKKKISYYTLIKGKYTGEINNQIKFWKDMNLENCSSNFPIIIDANNPNIDSTEEDRLKFIINDILLIKINVFTKEKGLTLFSFFLGIIYLLIYKYTLEEQVCLDTIIGTSSNFNFKDMIGLFNNTVIFPFNFKDKHKLTVKEYFNLIKENNINIINNSDVPLEKVVNDCKINSLPNIRLHFEFSNQNAKTDANIVSLNDCQIHSNFFENSSNSIRQLIIFNFAALPDKLDCFISYRKKCFTEASIQELKNNFNNLLENALNDSNLKLDNLLDLIKINTTFTDTFKPKMDKRLLAYKTAGQYPDINYNDFKIQLDNLLHQKKYIYNN